MSEYRDYLNRISIVVWAVTLALAIRAVVSLPGRGASLALGDQSLVVPFAAANLIPILLALLVGAGTEAAVQVHPLARAGELRLRIRLWALPVATTLIASVILPQAPSVLYWAAGLLLFAGLLAGILIALFYSLDAGATGYRRARASLNLVAYGAAFLLFVLVPDNWGSMVRSLALGGIGGLLALELLRGTQGPARFVALYALVVALMVAEMAWLLPLAGFSALRSGLLLVLLLYLLVGIASQSLVNRLNRRVALEFGLVATVALALILLFVP